ncbi:HNH endonuclease [Agarivorans sp. B2Z047]|uniref:HNH endonuclease signature motif containing protein n=1 Tax=Agarivorans sp. B2Z047 TaxID=2652721 RepID=UPI00128CD37D|nr:HNH endonuclease signature motif containing protein [Agarivorans sp. B2Z047]MPW31839.1 HNH endonuclease [Agarivorans sp. B2Z047]UQN41922.1 HNH endonuclease [Agarivorans sp. B2Z047]
MNVKYTHEMLEWLSLNRTLEINDYAKQFNIAFNCDKTPGQLHSLRKRKKWKTGRNGQFKKGNIPLPNARPKGPNKTSFKKGLTPPKWRKVGTEVITPDGFRKIKVAEPNSWNLIHVKNWEEANGKIPQGMVFLFKDGNQLNCDISNLELITRAEHLRLNQHNYKQSYEELRPTILCIVKLESKAFNLASGK